MSDTLAAICTTKRQHIAASKARRSETSLLAEANAAPEVRGFRHALEKKIKAGRFGLIAEIKKASPSHGLIRADCSPAALATAYEKGGAACLSVLTDEPYFQGKEADLMEARAAAGLPVLRKDFMLDPYQIIESRALGADCILLIMAALSDAQAQELEAAAQSLGMDVLVEVHDREELERALNQLKPAMIGINNRNLKTLAVDLATSESLAKFLPETILRVCESGITRAEDLRRMQKIGIECFLVGESLLRQADVTAAVQNLLE